MSGAASSEHLLDGRELAPELVGDRVQLLVHGLGIGLGEDRADRGGHHLLGALWHLGEDVAHEVDATPLPGGADHHGGDGPFEPLVGVGDHQLDARAGRGPAGCAGRPVQKAPSSESPTARPSTSRPPSARTPVAITTAFDTTCGPWWAFR